MKFLPLQPRVPAGSNSTPEAKIWSPSDWYLVLPVILKIQAYIGAIIRFRLRGIPSDGKPMLA